MRQIEGLRWAKPCERPPWLRKSRPRGLKAQGLRFERGVEKAVRRQFEAVKWGQWWEFEDSKGRGWCQTDGLIGLQGVVCVLECKLTEAEEARRQLEGLYFPVLRHVFAERVIGVVILRHLTRECRQELVVDGLLSALRRSEGPPLTVQWLGKGKI